VRAGDRRTPAERGLFLLAALALLVAALRLLVEAWNVR